MAAERTAQLNFGAKSLPLPAYFPSVSSVKTALPPQDYVRLLTSLVGLNGQFLVSAFDLADLDDPQSVGDMLAAARKAGAVTLMDCGNYESFWKGAQADWKQTDFHRMLGAFPCDLAFGFDEQNPPNDHGEHIRLVVARWRADQAAAGGCRIVPIIHAAAVELPGLCLAVARDTGVSMLAVPERALGDGVLERARTVRSIRAELDRLGGYVVLHLLGTGNPISLAVYTAMGADTFDGLEWCQTVVDHDTALLYHLSQADFFAGQTEWGDAGLSFQARTLAHNLEFFAGWMARLRAAVLKGRVGDFCRVHLPARAFHHCAKIAGWSLP
jgi:queuine/archaeosine tRNA-ribosyltransferase